MKKKKKIFITIIAVIFGLIIFIPFLAFGIVKWGILPPEKLTPLVVREVNKLIDGELQCEKIELTLFETYPKVGVQITNGLLISHALRDSILLEKDTILPYDTLISFKRLLVSVDVADYFFNNKLTIGRLGLGGARVNGYVNELGKANWDIYNPEKDSLNQEDSLSIMPVIDLQKLRIRNGYLRYEDLQADLYTEIQGLSLRLNGALTDGGNAVDLEMESSGLFFDSPSYSLENNLSLKVKSKMEIKNDFRTIRLENAEVLINEIPFHAAGVVSSATRRNAVWVDLEMSLDASDLNQLLDFVPDNYFQDKKKLQAKGSILLETNVRGLLSDSLMPTINLTCKLNKGSFFMKGVKQGIDSFEMDMDAHINGRYPDSSFVSLKQMKLNGLNTSLYAQGEVRDIYGSPSIDTYIKGKIDLTRLAREFLNPDTIRLRGTMDADISASFRTDDLLAGKYDKIQAQGNFNIDSLRAFSRPFGLSLFVKDAHFSVDSTKQTSSYLTNEDLLQAILTVDSLNVKYKRQINTAISKLNIQAKTSTVIDTSAVIPITTHIRFENMRTRLPDSVWVSARNAYLRGGLKPSATNKQIPTFTASITVDTLRYFAVPMRTGTILSKSTFNIEALPFRDAIRQRQQTRQVQIQDSTQTTRRRNTMAQNRQRRDSVTVTSSNPLRDWEVRGSVNFEGMRLFSRLFPLPMRMDKTSVKFDTNNITLKDAGFHAGKSDFLLNGEVSNLRRTLLRGGKLKGDFSIYSNYIDCNELIQAVNQGLLYADQLFVADEEAMDDETIENAVETNLEESFTMELSDTTEMLFLVPEYLDLSLKTKARKADFKDLTLEKIDGEIFVRNKSINLKKLKMNSNIGNGYMTMFYTTPDRTGASAGFEMDMENMLVDRLLSLYPEIDTLLPMLRSFEGVLDCQMSATCELDSTMNVIIPSLHSACYLHGENMVLLDGETFAEISKTLMFKNKERNVIDSISVDLIINENKIEIFPFLLEMDRYRVAVGGTHHMDMTFDYHLSVLKSPVPFKLGVDISGNLDKFKFKIVKCKYKDIFKPAREAELAVTRTNLRKEIRENIRKQMIENAGVEAFN